MRQINFLEAPAAVGHVRDPRVEDAGYAGELVDDLIDEFVRDAAVLFHSTRIALTDAFFVLINIEQTQLNGDFIAPDGKAAFHQSFGADSRPVFEIESAQRNAARLRIFDISRPVQHFKPAGKLEIVNHRVRDTCGQSIGIRCIRAQVFQWRHSDGKALPALTDDFAGNSCQNSPGLDEKENANQDESKHHDLSSQIFRSNSQFDISKIFAVAFRWRWKR